ncbi:beta family protein, partial [Shewanella sp. MBTL60-007]|uniref:beta family protein n=1 Tax=Shewanella sp. MBTL60-007 TaxID=2815911 RepID=UPI001C819ACD
MTKHIYYPLIKTRDAELRAFQNLSDDVMEKILPIYELTKSRKSKKAPDGDIHRRMKQIGDIQDGRPFILDLSTDSRYINPQIEQLMSPYNGFKDWQYFLNLYSKLNVIPMVHIYEDEGEDDDSTFTEVENFVAAISQIKELLAVRMPYDLDSEDYQTYLEPIIDNLNNGCKLIVLLDANFVRVEASTELSSVTDPFIVAASEVSELENIEDIVMLCTSFPSNVYKAGGDDEAGDFKIFEEDIYQVVSEDIGIKYGDYASINTAQIEMK